MRLVRQRWLIAERKLRRKVGLGPPYITLIARDPDLPVVVSGGPNINKYRVIVDK